VKVLNLGVSGNQSEETLALAKRWLPKLRPDLVVYGHCLNDFLPSEISRYTRYDIPLPHRVKRMFRRRTLIGGLAYYGYGQLLIALGLEADFYDDILGGIEAYDHRFAKDVRELNDLAVKTTGHPVLALVLNQMPANPRGRRVASLAETRMKEGGMIVDPADPYQDEYARSGISLKVSIWEGHPNALAHAVYAGELAKAILADPSLRRDLDRFRLSGPAAGQEKGPDASRTAGPEEDLERREGAPNRDSHLHDPFRLGALGTVCDLELDLLPFVERAIPVALDRAVVDEHVLTVVSLDESIALGIVEPLDLAFHDLTVLL